MIRRLEAYMGGVALTSLGGIHITDISYNPAQAAVTTTPLALAMGDRLLQRKWSQPTVTIEFITPGISPEKRQEKLLAIVEWARTGTLTTSDKPGLRLNAVMSTPPAMESALSRLERLKIGFTAYETPYWEDEIPTEAAMSGRTGSGWLTVRGTAEDDAQVEITATPNSGTLNSLSLTVGGNTIHLEGLGATILTPLRIFYEDNIQRIMVGDASALDKRTGVSADDLLAKLNTPNEIGFSADVLTSVQFSARGLWL